MKCCKTSVINLQRSGKQVGTLQRRYSSSYEAWCWSVSRDERVSLRFWIAWGMLGLDSSRRALISSRDS